MQAPLVGFVIAVVLGPEMTRVFWTGHALISSEKPVIGVNRLVDGTPDPAIETHPYDQATVERQIARTQRVRRERNPVVFAKLLEKLVAVAKDETQNIMPITIELVRAGVTMGDLIETLRGVWGTYRETPVY